MKKYLLEIDDEATFELVEQGPSDAIQINFSAKKLSITVLPEDPDKWADFMKEVESAQYEDKS